MEINAFKARRSQGEGSIGKIDDFVNAAQSGVSSSRSSIGGTPRKWNPTPTDENRGTDDWLGSPGTAKRSWKVKSTKQVLPNLRDYN